MKTLAPSRVLAESRRLHAAKALLSGVSQSEVARIYGVSRTSTGRWAKRLKDNDLKGRKAPGRPRRLSVEQEAQVVYLRKNFAWTHDALAAFVRETYGVTYHRDHIGTLLERNGIPKRARRGKRKE